MAKWHLKQNELCNQNSGEQTYSGQQLTVMIVLKFQRFDHYRMHVLNSLETDIFSFTGA